jgi:hypothetical protein
VARIKTEVFQIRVMKPILEPTPKRQQPLHVLKRAHCVDNGST